MSEKITLKDFWERKEKSAIHLNTEEQALTFCITSDKLGKKWCWDESYLEDNCWRINEEDTYCGNDGTHGYKESYENNDYIFYEFDEVDFGINEEETKEMKELNLNVKWDVVEQIYAFIDNSTRQELVDIIENECILYSDETKSLIKLIKEYGFDAVNNAVVKFIRDNKDLLI